LIDRDDSTSRASRGSNGLATVVGSDLARLVGGPMLGLDEHSPRLRFPVGLSNYLGCNNRVLTDP
jgi:hypothetical protein